MLDSIKWRNWSITMLQLKLWLSRNKKRSFIIFLMLSIIIGTYYLYQQGILEQIGSTNPKSPTVPTNLIATAVSSSRIDLSWGVSTDDVSVAGYKAYRNNVYLHSVATTSISDTGLNPLTQYCYRISAYDTEENESAQSTQACATTLAPEPPEPPLAPPPEPPAPPHPPTSAVKPTPKHKESLKEIIIKHIDMGWNSLKERNYVKAVEECKMVLKYDPNNKKASKLWNMAIEELIKRGEAFSAVGEYDRAINEFNIVLKYDPNNKKASEGKKEAEAKKK